MESTGTGPTGTTEFLWLTLQSDSPGQDFLGLRRDNLQHTVGVLGLDPLRLDLVTQPDDSAEVSTTPFDSMP